MTIATYHHSEWYSSILKIYKKSLFSAPFMTYTKNLPMHLTQMKKLFLAAEGHR